MSLQVLVSFELNTVWGAPEAFRSELEALGWRFTRDGKELPQGTCWAPFNDGISATRAREVAVGALQVACTTLERELGIPVVVRRSAVAVFPAQGSHFSVGEVVPVPTTPRDGGFVTET